MEPSQSKTLVQDKDNVTQQELGVSRQTPWTLQVLSLREEDGEREQQVILQEDIPPGNVWEFGRNQKWLWHETNLVQIRLSKI